MGMNDTNPPTSQSATAAPADAFAEKFEVYLAAARELGLDLRPITGYMLRCGDQFGIDLNAVGEVADEKEEERQSVEDYYDELMRAVWLLCEDQQTLIDLTGAESAAIDRAFARWAMAHLTTLPIEAAAMKAFVARWYEHRLEMARVYGAGEAQAADA